MALGVAGGERRSHHREASHTDTVQSAPPHAECCCCDQSAFDRMMRETLHGYDPSPYMRSGTPIMTKARRDLWWPPSARHSPDQIIQRCQVLDSLSRPDWARHLSDPYAFRRDGQPYPDYDPLWKTLKDLDGSSTCDEGGRALTSTTDRTYMASEGLQNWRSVEIRRDPARQTRNPLMRLL